MNQRPNRTRTARASTLAIAVSAAIAAASLVPTASAVADTSLFGATSVSGATITGQQWITDRTIELTIATPSFSTPAKVEVMFPVGYGDDTARRWPTTYYLGGTNSTQALFRSAYSGEALTSSYPSIVISPSASAGVVGAATGSGGNVGYWSDWDNNGAGGPPLYETFVTQQLIPLIDANFRTRADRAHRAVLGDSMGGYGAMMTAARHPDLFVASSSLSGAVDTNWAPGTAIHTISPLVTVAPADSVYGPRLTSEVNWRGHNPVDLAENLGTVDLQLFTGNGVVGTSELTEPTAVPFCAVESGVILPETQSLDRTLSTLGIPHAYTALNYGCHTAPMFEEEIAATLPRFAAVFAENRATPTSFDYRSTESTFTVFDWTTTADRARATEFLALKNVNKGGFTVTGSGITKVTTPAIFRSGKPVKVTIDGAARSVTAGVDGRLTVAVNLGLANATQQYTLGASNNFRTSVVTFE